MEKIRITYEGQPCRKCSTPVIKQQHGPKKVHNPNKYWFLWWFRCPNKHCKAMYMVEESKQEPANAPKPQLSQEVDAYDKLPAAAFYATAKRKIRLPSITIISFYDTNEWKRLRYAVLKKYGPTCQFCGATRENGVQIHVDHILPRSKYPELALDINNMQVLCEDCNLGKGAWDQTDWRTTASVPL